MNCSSGRSENDVGKVENVDTFVVFNPKAERLGSSMYLLAPGKVLDEININLEKIMREWSQMMLDC